MCEQKSVAGWRFRKSNVTMNTYSQFPVQNVAQCMIVGRKCVGSLTQTSTVQIKRLPDSYLIIFTFNSYGDKSPKSIVARIFSIIWIMMGLIVMAIFTASVTSALTAASLDLEPSNLEGYKVL